MQGWCFELNQNSFSGVRNMKYLHNSKNKRFTLFKPSSVPTNVMIAVIFMGLLTSKLHLEAEIENGPPRMARNYKNIDNSKSK